jgi:hemoglobin
MKEMRVKIDCLKELVKALQVLREDIVIKHSDHTGNTLFDQLGGNDEIKKIAQMTMQKMLNDRGISEFFMYSDIDLHEKRLGAYLIYCSGGSAEWIGASIKEAHEGKGIQMVHFNRAEFYLEESMETLKVPKDL